MTTWHIIRCTSGQEGRAERYLERMGYPHGWHPVRKVRLSEAVYKRLIRAWEKLGTKAASRKPERHRTQPFVHGYVFLPAETVSPFQINGHHPGVWMEVLAVDGAPYRLTDTDMAKMKDVPDRVQEIVAEAERAARAAWEAKRPKVGLKARITAGVFAGSEGEVISITHGQAEIDIGMILGRVKVAETMLVAVQPAKDLQEAQDVV